MHVQSLEFSRADLSKDRVTKNETALCPEDSSEKSRLLVGTANQSSRSRSDNVQCGLFCCLSTSRCGQRH